MKNGSKGMFVLIALLMMVSLLAACGGGNGDKGAAETASAPAPAASPEAKTGGEVNIYTARHYEVDGELYAKFTEATGIKVNVIEGKAPELIERMKREGASTAADLFITVDGGILNTAKTEGLLQPIVSGVIDEQVPADLRDKDSEWIGLSTRARVIVYAKDRVDPAQLSTYEDLATEKWKNKVHVRSAENL